MKAWGNLWKIFCSCCLPSAMYFDQKLWLWLCITPVLCSHSTDCTALCSEQKDTISFLHHLPLPLFDFNEIKVPTFKVYNSLLKAYFTQNLISNMMSREETCITLYEIQVCAKANWVFLCLYFLFLSTKKKPNFFQQQNTWMKGKSLFKCWGTEVLKKKKLHPNLIPLEQVYRAEF